VERTATLHFTGSGKDETLLCATFGFHFRHDPCLKNV
jgi:hypothetical protein